MVEEPLREEAPPWSPDTASAFSGGGRLLALRAIQYSLLFLSSLVVTRALGPDGRAHYALALNLALIGWALIHLSTGPAVARLLARREAGLEPLVRTLSALTLLLGAVGFAATVAVALPTRDSLLGGASVESVLLAAAFVPLTISSQAPATFLFRLGSITPYGWISVGAAGLQVALLLMLELTSGLTPEAALAIGAISLAVTVAALCVVLARLVRPIALIPAVDPALVRRTLGIGVKLHVASLAYYLNLRVDLLIVGALVAESQAGRYSLAVALVEIYYAAVTAIAIGALEAQTRATADAAAKFTMDFIRQNVAVATLLACVAAAVAYPFIVVVYGAAWKGSVVPFVILAVAVIALAVENPARSMLIRLAPPLWVSAASAASVIANVGLNCALIPALGITGAALASLVSYWVAAALMLAILARVSGIRVRRALAPPRQDDMVARAARRLMPRRSRRVN